MDNDDWFIDQLRNKSHSAFARLIGKYQDSIFNLCFYLTGSREDAEDCAQDAFVKMYRKIDTFKPDAPLFAWIRKIAVNTCRDHLKRPVRFFKFLNFEDQYHSNRPGPEHALLLDESTRLLHDAAMKLPLKLREVIVLREFDELSYSDIAAILKTSEGTVKSRLSRARAKLLKNFREQK